MKITISQSDLKEALSIAQSTLSSSLDITSHFLFVCDPKSSNAYVCSTDAPRTFSMIPLTGSTLSHGEDVEEEVRFTVEGKRIMNVISHVEGVLTLSYDEDQKELEFKDSNGVNYFSSLNPSDFPPFEDKYKKAVEKIQTKILISANKLYETLHALKPYVSTDDTRRPELCVVAFVNGVAHSCDGFGLGMVKDDSFKDLNGLKIHQKDISSMMKYLKAHQGNDVEYINATQSTFFKMSDGAVYGFMDTPHQYPDQITTTYKNAFDFLPNRSWAFNKSKFISALSFLSAGADSENNTITFTDDLSEPHLCPRIEMSASSSSRMIGRDVSSVDQEIPLREDEEIKDFDFSTIPHIGQSMLIADRVNRAKGDAKEDVPSWKFNGEYMKRVLDSLDDTVYFGVEKESDGRGYIVFKNSSPSDLKVTSVVGWNK